MKEAQQVQQTGNSVCFWFLTKHGTHTLVDSDAALSQPEPQSGIHGVHLHHLQQEVKCLLRLVHVKESYPEVIVQLHLYITAQLVQRTLTQQVSATTCRNRSLWSQLEYNDTIFNTSKECGLSRSCSLYSNIWTQHGWKNKRILNEGMSVEWSSRYNYLFLLYRWAPMLKKRYYLFCHTIWSIKLNAVNLSQMSCSVRWEKLSFTWLAGVIINLCFLQCLLQV